MDLSGFTPLQADLEFVCFMIDVIHNYYPRRLARILLVDAPDVFESFWKGVCPLLHHYKDLHLQKLELGWMSHADIHETHPISTMNFSQRSIRRFRVYEGDMCTAAGKDASHEGRGLRLQDGLVKWTPHPVIVTIGDNRDYIRVPLFLLYHYYRGPPNGLCRTWRSLPLPLRHASTDQYGGFPKSGGTFLGVPVIRIIGVI